MTDVVRVRYAPSPTGFQHIGNLRTALFNWLFARHSGGKFIIRIEDTDRERSEDRFVDAILDDFRWLGIDWDEGPEAGGDFGPYKQSERLEIYQKHIDALLTDGRAYRCYCTPDELEARRKEAMATGGTPGYDGRCRELSSDERSKLDAAGRASSVRFHVAAGDAIVFDDMVLGETRFERDQIGDFVIQKSDGWPTYHFGVVVDDWHMKITHVIRAEGHLSNTPLHVLLMEALGAPRPRFAHLPSVLSEDGKGKLSKRLGALSMIEYRRRGYLPEAVMNFMALLGWSPGDDREMLTRDELVETFALERVRKGSARFDTEKLRWMNGRYMRTKPAAEMTGELRECIAARYPNAAERAPAWYEMLIEAYREKADTLGEMAEKAAFLFAGNIEYVEKDVQKWLLKGEGAGLAMLKEVRDRLGAIETWSAPVLEEALAALMAEKEVGFGKVAQPIRVALTGSSVSPGIHDTLMLVGRDESLARMDATLERFSNT